jgi:hypothetical protein
VLVALGLSHAAAQPVAPHPVDDRRRGGALSVPGDPDGFVTIEEVLADAPPDLPLGARLAPYAWPSEGEAADGVLRIFVQGFNTPRRDDPQGDIGADARLRRYISEGYLSAPLISFHNGTHMESPSPSEGLSGWWSRTLRRAVPLPNRDVYAAASMRFLGVGAGVGYVSLEIRRLAMLLEENLVRARPCPVHLVGFSDGSLLIENALARAARRAEARVGKQRVRQALETQHFIEHWGNSAPPKTPGPRRLLLHAANDPITYGRSFGRQIGVSRLEQVPPSMRDRVAIVSFETDYASWDAHNALTSIGPALKAMLRLELGAAADPAGPAPFARTPTLLLYERLAAQGARERHYGNDVLEVDYERYRDFVCKACEAALEGDAPPPPSSGILGSFARPLADSGR